jgi:hypothetical protein
MSAEKHYPTNPAGELDAGDDRAHRESPRCCARVTEDGRSGWCRLRDGHRGDHVARLSTPLPTQTFMPKGSK